ncbi:MAG: electron transfer flavoprotein subunit alpha/FixB family protein [Lachnospirales bacterium]
MGDICVFIEQRDGIFQKVGFELISEASKLASKIDEKVVAVALGHNIADKAEELVKYGADEVVVIDNEMLKEFVTEPYTKALVEVIKDRQPEAFLIGATSIGRDLAPRVSARVKTGLTADCTELDVDAESKNFFMTRPAFGGNIMATIICENHRPQMATVRPGVMKTVVDENKKGVITNFTVDFKPSDMNIKIRDIIKKENNKVDILDQNILVSGGRGIGTKENFEKLQGLADTLKGGVSSSRACVDAGVMERDLQVGQTGKTVRPDVYFAMGISGAIQHVVGMENSELIIAVNKDKFAPIFETADLGIVGDANQIIPKLTEALAKKLAER